MLAALALLGALACGREAGPSGVRKRPDAAAAAAAAGTAPGAAVESESEKTGRRGGGEGQRENLGGQQVDSKGVLIKTNAEQLLGGIRASGKKGTLVNMWASWCGPCRRELPMLQALSSNLKAQGVAVVLVSVDDEKDEAKAVSFLKANGITLDSYVVSGGVRDFKAGVNPRWPGMLPASFLFNASAELVHFWAGEAFEEEIVPVIESFLAGRPIEEETRFGLAPGKVEK